MFITYLMQEPNQLLVHYENCDKKQRQWKCQWIFQVRTERFAKLSNNDLYFDSNPCFVGSLLLYTATKRKLLLRNFWGTSNQNSSLSLHRSTKNVLFAAKHVSFGCLRTGEFFFYRLCCQPGCLRFLHAHVGNAVRFSSFDVVSIP